MTIERTLEAANAALSKDTTYTFNKVKAHGLDLTIVATDPDREFIAWAAIALGVPVEDLDDVWGGCPTCGYGTEIIVHGWLAPSSAAEKAKGE